MIRTRNSIQYDDMIIAICYNRNGDRMGNKLQSSGFTKISDIVSKLIEINKETDTDIVRFLINNDTCGWINWYDKFGRITKNKKK